MADQPVFYTPEELEDVRGRIRAYIQEGEEAVTATINDADDDMIRGCKFTALIAMDAQKKGTDLLCDAYVNYPPFMFYTDRARHDTILRIYGMDLMNDASVCARTICALTGFNNITTRPLDACVHVKQWSASQRDRLASGLYRYPEIFTEWNGFLTASACIDHS
jgi:hypothetical protein